MVAAVTAGLKNDDVLFLQSVALFEISNDCVSCSGLVDTACLIPSPSRDNIVDHNQKSDSATIAEVKLPLWTHMC